MWKVTLDSRFGAASIYWVDGSSAADAETIARQQAGTSITEDAHAVVELADDLDPSDDVWPRPQLVDGVRVFTFDDSREAYDQSQVRDDIHDGDVLYIPSDTVAGFLMRAWPVAVSAKRGAFHRLVDPSDLVIDGTDYSAIVHVAQSLLDTAEPPAAAVPPSFTDGLHNAPNVWTVTIAGSERHDGESPYLWVVNAANATIAAATAERHHRTNEEDTDTVVRYVDPGAPDASYPYAYNDLRGIPSRTLVLTSDSIRRIAQIRLAYRRLDRHIERVNASPRYAAEADEAGCTLARTTAVTVYLRLLMDELGYGI